MAASALPHIHFDTDDLPPPLRFPYFRDSMAVAFDVALHETPEAEFGVRADIWRLGQITVNSREVRAGLRFERDTRRVRTDGIDHYLLILMHQGGWVGQADGVDMVVPQGAVAVLDLARTMRSVTPRNLSVSLTVPRDGLEPLLPLGTHRHGLVVQGAAGGLLADYLGSLERRLPYLTEDEVPHIERGTCDLIAACVAPTRERLERAGAQLAAAQRLEAKRVIDERLADPELAPEHVAAALRLSRTTLYALFERDGGVAAFIRRRRLRAISRALINPAERRRISEIAFACGFKSEAHFSRAFRQEFGATPSDVRAEGLASTTRRDDVPDLGERYKRWIRLQDE